MADGIDMGEVVRTSQATTFDVLGKSFALTSARQAIIADRKFDELDVEQSMANRYALAGVPNESTASGK